VCLKSFALLLRRPIPPSYIGLFDYHTIFAAYCTLLRGLPRLARRSAAAGFGPAEYTATRIAFILHLT
jgi:hypothetical protein